MDTVAFVVVELGDGDRDGGLAETVKDGWIEERKDVAGAAEKVASSLMCNAAKQDDGKCGALLEVVVFEPFSEKVDDVEVGFDAWRVGGRILGTDRDQASEDGGKHDQEAVVFRSVGRVFGGGADGVPGRERGEIMMGGREAELLRA